MIDDDSALLRRYAEICDEAAFAEVVRRHLDGVYSIARRRVGGDAHLAEDVTQQVFLELARNAKRLAAHPVLAGWIFTTTRNAAANVVRGERRRKAHEQEAHTMHDALAKGPAEADWNRLAPLIEQAVDRLGESDRVAVLLRFVERRTFGEIGAALRVSEDGARKRVDRALEKLRGILGRSGVNSSAAALAGALTTHAVTAAPAGLAAAVTGTAIAGAATVAASGGLTLLTLMSMTKIQVGLAAGIVLVAALTTLSVQTKNARLEREIAELRRQGLKAGRLRAENIRLLAERPRGEPLPERAEPSLAAGVTPVPVTPTPSPEMRLVGSLQNRGQATPEAAWETLFWAIQARDHRALARVIMLEPAEQRLAETLWARVPDYVRAQRGVASAEELFALMWGGYYGDRFAWVHVAKATTFDTEHAEIVSESSKVATRMTPDRRMAMDFRRTADGWKFIVSTDEAENTVGETVRELRSVLKPAP